jgi:amidase
MWLGAHVTADVDASALAADVRAGRTTARVAVEDALDRIARHRTNAVIRVAAVEARAAAAHIDAAIARGDDPGPLAGVPFTVKDTLATAGLGAAAGSRVLADHIPARDASVVGRLRSAGAVLVGKTNCPEFALQARTDNRLFGPTQHPLGAGWSPGGSSGGCAAAVAGGLVPFSIGGDYGGSIRYPAACTGIYGLRPTSGAVPTDGHVPPPAEASPRHRFQTVGPLARTARDIGLVFGVIAGSATRPFGATDASIGELPVGVVRGGWTCTGAITDAIEATALALSDAGFDVFDLDAAPFVEAAAVFDAWRATDDYADLRALVAGHESDLSSHIARLLAMPPTPADPRTALAAVARAVDALLARTPLVILPVARVGVLAADATSVEVGGVLESVDALQILAPARAVSLLGLPALAVPAGVDRLGLPVGVQIVGRPGAERELIAAAARLASSDALSPALGDPPMASVDDHL